MSTCTKCGGKGYVEVHQPGHTHRETDAECPAYHFARVPCSCNRVAELEAKLAAVERERDMLLGKPGAVHLGAQAAIEALRQTNKRDPHVRRLVEAARAYLEKQTAARQLELAAALKPFEEI